MPVGRVLGSATVVLDSRWLKIACAVAICALVAACDSSLFARSGVCVRPSAEDREFTRQAAVGVDIETQEEWPLDVLSTVRVNVADGSHLLGSVYEPALYGEWHVSTYWCVEDEERANAGTFRCSLYRGDGCALHRAEADLVTRCTAERVLAMRSWWHPRRLRRSYTMPSRFYRSRGVVVAPIGE